jgi:thymidine phosphorylase
MNQPLAPSAGNAVEVADAVAFLTRAKRFARLEAVTIELGAEMLVIGGLAASLDEARARLTATLEDGRAAEVFGRMVAGLGGPTDFIERAGFYLPRSAVTLGVLAETSGTVERIDTRALGIAVIELGGGRTRPQDTIDHAVGLSDIVGIGAEVAQGQTLAIVHAASADAGARAAAAVARAIEIGPGHLATGATIIERIGRENG